VCEGAKELAGPILTLQDTLVGATNDVVHTLGHQTSAGVWYRLRLPIGGGRVTLSTCGSGIDTLLGVYRNCDRTSTLAFNDDHADGDPLPSGVQCGERESYVQFSVSGASQVYILVRGRRVDDIGSIKLSVKYEGLYWARCFGGRRC
jgi:hypothetical protein